MWDGYKAMTNLSMFAKRPCGHEVRVDAIEADMGSLALSALCGIKLAQEICDLLNKPCSVCK